MALKDCKFFVDIDGRQVEMDFDGFRAHLMREGVMATLAPDLTQKRGKTAGFTLTARAEAAPVKAEAPKARAEAKPTKAEAPAPSEMDVTAENLQKLMPKLGEKRANAIIAVMKAMGIPFDRLKLAKGKVEAKGTLQQADVKARDAEYVAAVKAGDTAKAQKMVDEAAKAAGYDFAGWRAVSKSASQQELESRPNSYVTANKEAAEDYKLDDDYVVQRVLAQRGNTLTLSSLQDLIRLLPDADIDPDGYVFEELDKARIRSAIWAKGYQAIDFPDISPDNIRSHRSVLLKDSGTIKSADPITYDDKGNVIPLSQRFKPESSDIRYQEGELAQAAYHATRGLFAPEPGFPNGRFRLDKVNTGLGVQAFAHGIYIAEDKAGVADYVEMLEAEAPGSVMYELDVPDGIVAKLATYNKPLSPEQFAALKGQVQSMLGEKAAQAIADLGEAKTSDLIDRIQDAVGGEDAARRTSEAFSKAGIPGVKVEAGKDFDNNKSFYVIWNQAALDRVALMKANEEPLQAALKPVKPEKPSPLGSIEFLDDLNALISVFEKANFSTVLHEGMHFYRRHMLNVENGFTPKQIKDFEDWAGAKNGVWSVAAEEKAARGFEKYLRDGIAPIPELKELFREVAKWMRQVYKTLRGSAVDIDIPPNIREVFDRIFTLEAERQGLGVKVQTGKGGMALQQADFTPAPDVLEAAKKWAGVGEISPSVSSRLTEFYDEYNQVTDRIREALRGKPVSDIAGVLPNTEVFANVEQGLPEAKRANFKEWIGELVINLLSDGVPSFAIKGVAQSFGVSEADIKRLPELTDLVFPKATDILPDPDLVDVGFEDVFIAVSPEVESKAGASLKDLSDKGTFKTGKPVLVEVYHGTGAEGIKGNEFSPLLTGTASNAESAEVGYFFSGTTVTAGRYASKAAEKSKWAAPPKVLKFFVKMRNPLVYDQEADALKGGFSVDAIEGAKAAGHDGVIITNTFDGGPLDSIFVILRGNENQIKSADPTTYDDSGKPIATEERFQAGSRDIRYQEDTRVETVERGGRKLYQVEVTPEEGPVFTDNILEALKTWAPKGTPEQLKAHLIKTKGVIAEANWIGLPLFLEGRETVTRDEVAQFVEENRLSVREVLLSSDPGYKTLWESLQLYPRGKEYRELLFLLPRQSSKVISSPAGTRLYSPTSGELERVPQGLVEKGRESHLVVNLPRFTQKHYPRAKNLVAHVRFNERSLADGSRVLFIEEIQSDWAQAKRRGKTELAMPFQDTPRWTMLAFKRMLRWATDNGYDKIAWTTGAQQTARWGGEVFNPNVAREDVDTISYERIGNALEYDLTVTTLRGEVERYKNVSIYTIGAEFGADVRRAIERYQMLRRGTVSVPEIIRELKERSGTAERPLSEIAKMRVKVKTAQNGRKVYDLDIDYKDGTKETLEQQWLVEIAALYGDAFTEWFRGNVGREFTVDTRDLNRFTPLNEPAPTRTGQSMQQYYDRIVPTEIAKYVKPLGGKVTREPLETGQRVHVVNVTDKMRELALKGQMLFQKEGEAAFEGETTGAAFRRKQAKERQKRLEAAMRKLRGEAGKAEAPKAEPKAAAPKAPPKPGQPKASKQPASGQRRRGFGDKTIDEIFERLIERAEEGTLKAVPMSATEALESRIMNGLRKVVIAAYVENRLDPSVADDALRAAKDVLDAQQSGNQAEMDSAMNAFNEVVRKASVSKPKTRKSDEERLKEKEAKVGQPKKVKSDEELVEAEINRYMGLFAERQSKLDAEIEIDGKKVSRREYLLKAMEDLRQAVKNKDILGQAKARGVMKSLIILPPHPSRPFKWSEMMNPAMWGQDAPRSPLSTLNMIGSYEAVAGELGKMVSELFHLNTTLLAQKYYSSTGEALADLEKQLEPLLVKLDEQGYRGMRPTIEAHVERMRQSYQGVGELNKENIQRVLQDKQVGNLTASVLKAFVFNTSLRFNPKSVLMNELQPLFTLWPFLTTREFVKIAIEARKPETIARVRDIAIQASGGRYENLKPGQRPKFDPFSRSSETARIMGHLAGELIAERRNLVGPNRYRYITEWTAKVEFDNSARNSPPLFWGPMKSTFFQFKPYQVKNLERLYYDWKYGIEGASSGTTARRAKIVTAQLLVGGVGSLLTVLPGLKNITGVLILGYLANGLSKALGDDEWGNKFAEAIYYGAPAFIGLDLSSSVGFLDEPFGETLAKQALNFLTGPAVYKFVVAAEEVGKYFAEREKPAPLGRESEKEERLERQGRKVFRAITPLARMGETAYDVVVKRKRPELYLDKEMPLTDTEVALRLAGGSPLRQTRFFDEKEAYDWQKRLLNRPVDVPGIERAKGEPESTYQLRVQRRQEYERRFLPQLQTAPAFQKLPKLEQDAVLDALQRNITEQAAMKKPDLRKLTPGYLLKARFAGAPERRERERKRLYNEPKEEK